MSALNEAVATAIVVLVIVASVTLAWLLGRAVWQARVSRLRDHFWRELGEQLVSVVGDDAREAAWLEEARTHTKDVVRYCLDAYVTRTSGAYREHLARLYRDLGLLADDLVHLRSRRWRVRMRAVRRLASAVTPDHREAIMALASEGGEMRLLVAQIIGRIGTAEDVVRLLSGWTITSRLGEYPAHVMVDRMRPAALAAVILHWDELGCAKIQRIVLSAAARITPSACRDLLPRAAAHPSIEVRIAACRAAGVMASSGTRALLVMLAGDPTWEVRAQAVKALAAHSSDDVRDLLVTSLCDASFWVRQNAASALGTHGPFGIERLRIVAAKVGDRFARDAAEHVLTDYAIGRGAALEVAA